MSHKVRIIVAFGLVSILSGAAFVHAAGEDVQKQIEAIMGALPKMAIPMREVGSRFQNIYYAAKGGNWALAAYMSRYMNKALNPAKVTKPDEYKTWSKFYTKSMGPVNKAIAAKDFAAFEKAYGAAIEDCNACHEKLDYKFIQVIKMSGPADPDIDYSLKSEPSDLKD